MHYILRLFFFLAVIPLPAMSQMHPTENAILNYRIIGFSFPADEKCNNYTLEIARGNYDDENSFQKNIIVRRECNSSRVVEDVPSFGMVYTWRVISKYKSGAKKSKYFHFSTGFCFGIDTLSRRLRVTTNTGAHNDKYVFMDNSKILYDMQGNPVWYLPGIDEIVNEKCMPRDIKLTPQGTLTMIVLNYAYEISYDGRVLWKAPMKSAVNADSTAHYHHEFTRLNNGHYMIMDTESGQLFASNEVNSPGQRQAPVSQSNIQKFVEGKLCEYDENGNLIWQWKTSQYFFKSDLVNRKAPGGGVNTDLHDNSFYFDEKNKEIYISCRDINRVLKISYPDGNVLGEYGVKYKPGITNINTGMFCGQHSIRKSDKGYIYLFNNNTCNREEYPEVLIFKEATNQRDSLELIWKYECTTEGMGPGELVRARSMSGGSVDELEDGSILVCMGTPCAKVFIVSRDKKILWSAMPEMRAREQWRTVPIYRTSIVNGRKDLERLIWNSHKPTE
jgi:hypothetical protein